MTVTVTVSVAANGTGQAEAPASLTVAAAAAVGGCRRHGTDGSWLARAAWRAAPASPGLLFACLAACLSADLTACAGSPPPRDWQLNARGAMDRAAAAWLAGDSRVEAAEFARARTEVARTGRVDLLATIELTRCAWRVASLQFEDCAGFGALAADAGAPERAYAAYLAGQGQPADAALLPVAQQAVARDVGAPAAALAAIADPLSRLVAAGVLQRRAAVGPEVMALAVDTASAEGWNRPLLAWLHAERLRAEAGGDAAEAARLRRRIARVLGPYAGDAAAAASPASATPAPGVAR